MQYCHAGGEKTLRLVNTSSLALWVFQPGKALGSRRKKAVLATKVGFPTGPGPNDRGLSRLAWLLAQEIVTSVIIRAKRLNQLEDNLGAVSIELTGEDLKRLDEASALPDEYPGWFTRQFDVL